MGERIDRQARWLFIMPAVLMILVFSIFPLIASALLALSRVRLQSGGYTIKFVGLLNFKKQLFGSEQFHLFGNFGPISPLGWAAIAVAGALVLWWMIRYLRGPVQVIGLIGRLLTVSAILGLTLLFATTLLSDRQFGSLGVTLFYVLVGCAVQFFIGLGLAIICAKP
jgi:multiple sugar transport system permease protein